MKDRVRFKNPPVVEVVCGVLFALPRPLKGAEVGLFWQQIAKDFPELREAPPLASIVEQFDDATVQEDGAQLLSMPPLRRTWMLSSDGHHLVQVQDDRFLFNWKKAADETVHDRLHGRDQHQADYPSYDHVIERFNHHLRGFQGFLTSRQAGAMQFQQYELTYVNHVGSWNGLKVVPMAAALVDQSREIGRERFLPEPAGFQWVTTYDLPDGMAGCTSMLSALGYSGQVRSFAA